ncbi:5'-nucleotidase [Bertholletia excelsa]
MNKNFMPPGLVSNLEEVLRKKKGGENEQSSSKDGDDESTEPSSSSSEIDESKPLVLVTNGDGIESPGLTHLVEALARDGLYNVFVCAPQSDKSFSGHSVTVGETIEVTSAKINGAIAYEFSGTPVDCVSLVLSGALFSWSKPLVVISGINRGCNHMVYSGGVAAAREALMSGVPAISISLNWKKGESQESDFKDAVIVCLPLIKAAIRDIEKGNFPRSCLLNIQVPASPSTNKGFKLTKQSQWRPTLSWRATSNKSAGRFVPNHQAIGVQLAQLGRDASAAGVARRLNTQGMNMEVVESVGVSGKSDSKRSVKYFRLEFLEKEHREVDEDFDFKALENGFVAITPIFLSPHIDLDNQAAASEWVSTALQEE